MWSCKRCELGEDIIFANEKTSNVVLAASKYVYNQGISRLEEEEKKWLQPNEEEVCRHKSRAPTVLHKDERVSLCSFVVYE